MKIPALFSVIVVLFAGAGECGPLQEGGQNTMVFAHRASSGLWHQNSRNAVVNSIREAREGSLRGKLHGIEVDIALTRDGVPVLSHQPWIDKSLCVRSDGSAVGHVLIRDVEFKELQDNYLCGGVRDPKFPTATTFSESVLGFDEFLSYLKSAPELAVYLDLKIESGITASAETYAKAVFGRWSQAEMQNKLYVEGPTAEALATYRRYAKVPFTAVLSVPSLTHRDNWFTVARTALKVVLFPSDPLKRAKQADAVASPVEVMTKAAQERLQTGGKEVVVFTLNDQKALSDACKSGIDLIITDYPNLGPCS